MQEHIPHYRIPFYESLKDRCVKQMIDLEVIYSPQASIAAIPGDLNWAKKVKSRKICGFTFQQLPRSVWKGDLIIVPQETKYFMTYFLLLWYSVSRRKIGMWGHGRDFQTENSNSLKNKFKRWLSRRVDWWFAYNARSVEVVKDLGYPPDQITSVKNSINVTEIKNARDYVSDEQLDELRGSLGIKTENVAIFTGRFSEIKRTAFLLETAQLIRQKIPDFHLILIGKGSLQNLVNEACNKNNWIHSVGVKNDEEKVPFWMISKLLLMPGAVGLVVLDTFALGVPMLTTDIPNHGPEIAYFKDGVHGIIVKRNDPVAYAQGVVNLFRSPAQLASMKAACLAEGDEFSTELMASNFAKGINEVLSQ